MNTSVETILLYTIAAGFLSIVYGFFTGKNILSSSNGNSKIFQTIKAAKSDEQKIERAFISILSRYPSADEKKIFLEEYELNGSAATNNMVSALISTGEFMFVQ